MKRNNIINFKRDPQIPGLELCDVKESNHHFPSHYHDDIYAFSLMESGGNYWTQKQKNNSLVEPGNLAMINPGVLHSGSPYKDNESTYKMIYLDKKLVNKTFTDIIDFNNFDLEFEHVIINSLSDNENFKSLYNSILSNESPLEKESSLFHFLGELSEINAVHRPIIKSNNEPKMIKIATNYLSANLDIKISLDEISNIVGLSKYHFLRVFKSNTGTSPHIYRMQKRIDKAKVHLLNGEPLTQVALETGFSDQSHLSNKFREYTGATPKQYFTINK